jgi:phosphate transport system permease protein
MLYFVALPISICTAIYLEEFAPKNLFTTLIEININNLAAIPSIVFGLLGLSVLINIFGMPRSAPITAGITLAMMILPILVITTRQAIKSVPTNVKHAALALGATKMQVILHHTLPLSMPGIATGVILSVARAIGETAPLILIGMVAFIVDIPHNIFEPATALPVQIYLWSSNPETAFQAKTAAAILFLLSLLILINMVAVYIRKKYENRW